MANDYLGEDWKWLPSEAWEDDWPPEREAEQEERDEARAAAFTERLYWQFCLSAQSDNMVVWDIQVGLDDHLSAMLDEETRWRFRISDRLPNEHEDAWVAFDVREDAAMAIDRLVTEERIEFVVRNGTLCVHVPGAVDMVTRNLERVPEHSREKWRGRIRRLSELRSMPYADYLQTPEWQRRRDLHRESALSRCQLCNKKSRRGLALHVHHRTYERRGSERFSDLIVLCEGCHRHFHGIT